MDIGARAARPVQHGRGERGVHGVELMANSDLASDANEDDELTDDDVPVWPGTERRAPTRADAGRCARVQLLALIQATFSEQGRARLAGIYDVRVVYSALFDHGFISDPRDAVAVDPHPIYDNPACRRPEFVAALEAIDPTTCRERADLLALIARAPDADSRDYLQSILDFRMPGAADSQGPLE